VGKLMNMIYIEKFGEYGTYELDAIYCKYT
jgi:hypothetical protein